LVLQKAAKIGRVPIAPAGCDSVKKVLLMYLQRMSLLHELHRLSSVKRCNKRMPPDSCKKSNLTVWLILMKTRIEKWRGHSGKRHERLPEAEAVLVW